MVDHGKTTKCHCILHLPALTSSHFLHYLFVPSFFRYLETIEAKVCGHYLFRDANSFPRAQLEENYELRGTDNVQGQISKHIFAPNGGYWVYCPSNLLRNAHSFGKLGYVLGYPPAYFSWGIFGHATCLDQSLASEKI